VLEASMAVLEALAAGSKSEAEENSGEVHGCMMLHAYPLDRWGRFDIGS